MPKVGSNGFLGRTRAPEPGDPTAAHPLELAQADLANEREPWWELWQGMPEFVQRDLEPWRSVTVHFENRAALDDFARLIGQKVPMGDRRASTLWHPQADKGKYANKRYACLEAVDEPWVSCLCDLQGPVGESLDG